MPHRELRVVENFGMEPLGDLVRRLRRNRGLTQRALGDLAGFNDEVIGRVEQGRMKWGARTGRLVLEALARNIPVSMTEAHDFLVGSEASPSIDGHLPETTQAELRRRGLIRNEGPRPTIEVCIDDDPSIDPELYGAVDDLAIKLGRDRVLHVLRMLNDSNPLPFASDEDAEVDASARQSIADRERTLSLQGQPRRMPDGHIEQVNIEVTEKPAPPNPKNAVRRRPA